jgi:hypothetical protein
MAFFAERDKKSTPVTPCPDGPMLLLAPTEGIVSGRWVNSFMAWFPLDLLSDDPKEG